MADSLDVVDILNRLRSRWRVWAVAALAGAAIGGGVSALRPVRYVAETHLLVEPPPDAAGTFMMMSPSYLDSLKSYAVLAESETVRSRALASLSNGHREAAGAVEAETPTMSRVVIVRADGRDPESALALARAAAEQTLRMIEAVRPEDVQRGGSAERVLLIDPGVPPERPEDRGIAVNAMAAALLALAAAGVYEGVRAVIGQTGQDV